MKEYFKREKDKNYLIFEEDLQEENYKYKMLCFHKIRWLLECKIYHIDDKTRMQYDISSKQSLYRICEKKNLDREKFQKVLLAVQGAIHEISRYFLNLDELYLQPEYIYADMESFEIYFCYYPRKKDTLACEEFHKLAEYLINHLDYEDKELVEQGYGLYRCTLQEHYDIVKSIKKVMKKQEKYEQEVSENIKEEEREQEEVEWKGASKIAEQGMIASFFQRFKGENFGLGQQKEEIYDSVVEDEDEEEEEETYGHTMLLKEVKNKPVHYLVALSEEGYQDFAITKFPYVIGKGREWADGVIPHSLISRIHAQLEEEDGEIFISDLNSTNGTGVNDVPLEANETVQLKSGDIVNFSEVYYRFV